MTAYTDSLETPIYTIAKCLNEIIVNNDLDEALQNIVDWLAESLEIDCCFISENGSNAVNQAIFTSQNGIIDNINSDNNHLVLNINHFPEIHSAMLTRIDAKG